MKKVFALCFLVGMAIGINASAGKKCSIDRDGVEHCWHSHDWTDWEDTGASCCRVPPIPGCLVYGTKRTRECTSCGETDHRCR